MKEKKFQQMIKDADLSDKEEAILRREFELPYDDTLIDNVGVYRNRLLRKALAKMPHPEMSS